MTSDEIRQSYLDFFEARDHKPLPSAPLVPAAWDTSTLLISAGMHPLKPYFLGLQDPPHHRLTTCQKCFRSTDIDVVGTTERHLTFFEMLGNFSIGDYFKQGAVEYAWEFSLEVLGLERERIWISVFEGDEELGLGPDEEAIEAWRSVGVSPERIVGLSRADNFWQAGPVGPCGPCSELYYDRGLEFGAPDDAPGGENDRFIEYWNLVFMQFDQNPVNHLTPLPMQSIDTGLGVERMATILQDAPSIYESDNFAPLLALGEELSGRRYGEDDAATRALRVLSDHSRGMTFLISDGVVPSNEDRGYVLRRVMRRAIQQGRSLGMEPGFLPKFADRVIEIMGAAYPELHDQREIVRKWVTAEEEGFGRTLEQGTRLLEDLIARAREEGEEGIGAEDAFRLHDTYGFPFELTRELAAEHDLGVDEPGFATLMEEQRARARASAGTVTETARDAVREFATATDFVTRFTGYETLEQHTTVAAVDRANGEVLVKLAESPFYAAGGGQVSDAGTIECDGGECRGHVADVFRVGDDQAVALVLDEGALEPGERVVARVDARTRRATEANHTATHLLHAALRRRLGDHVRQAGSYVGPDKLRFDFTHGQALTREERSAIEDEVNAWILDNHPVHALTTTLDEAKRLGAMALFGEKYGDVVRMVEVGPGDFSRELCGGTHVRSTAEVGVFKVMSESSSAANVRRIEALTGPEAVALLRRHDEQLDETAATLRTTPEGVVDAVRAREVQRRELEKRARSGGAAAAGADLDALAQRAVDVDGATILTEVVTAEDQRVLLELADRLKGRIAPAAIVLGCAVDGRVHLVASVDPELVARGVRAGAVVKVAAEAVGGGGGGRDTMAQAGGRNPDKLPEALRAAREAIESALRG